MGAFEMSMKPRVLIVDDDHVIASTMSLILNATGFDSLAAFSGDQALDLARSHPFHILVTDVNMEPMNGIELGIAFLDIHSAASVFLITGSLEVADDALEALPRGRQFPLLQKPVHPQDLIERLRSVSVLTVDSL
jgi:DNA-binding NtrC family response regulator